jgi:hypothetical protein
MKAKAIIEQEVNKTPGDIWRQLSKQSEDIKTLVKTLRKLAPEFVQELDTIVSTYEAKVAEAAKAVKKTKVQANNKLLAGVIDSDPFGEKVGTKEVTSLLGTVNAMGWEPKFKSSGPATSSGNTIFASSLNDTFDIEVDPDDLAYFEFVREYDKSVDELQFITGAILPDGQIYVNSTESYNESNGPYLFKNAEELVNELWNWDTGPGGL